MLAVSAALVGFAVAASGQPTCEVTFEVKNRNRYVSGPVNEECGINEAHTPPFGNWGVERPSGSKFTKRVLTDGRGRYEASGIPPGSLAVVAIRKGTRMTPQRFQTREGGSVTADFVMPN